MSEPLRLRPIGHSGIRASRIALGAMNWGDQYLSGPELDECARILDRYRDAGGNLIDTAHGYAQGHSEAIVGELTRPDREYWVLSTKYGRSDRPTDPNAGGASTKNMIRQLEQSLTRLHTDYIDVYWCHAWDRYTPIEEVMAGLHALVQAGKVRAIGLSNFPADLVAEADTLARERHWTRLAGIQLPYSLIERHVEQDYLPMARRRGLTPCTWEPLGAGLLTGRFGTDREETDSRIHTTIYRNHKLTDRNRRIAEELNQAATILGVPAAQLALAWTLHHPATIPIVGARTATQISDTLGAAHLALPDEIVTRLDNASRPALTYPADLLNLDDTVDPLGPYGTTRHLMDAATHAEAVAHNGPDR
jgi:aryl-alcohol dehydrogenase-like predicted oxidoreductase